MNPLLSNQYASTRYDERIAGACRARRAAARNQDTEPGFVLISRTAVRRPRWWTELEAGRTVHELHTQGGRILMPATVRDDEDGECVAC